jgi:hypothetical protein
MWPAGDPINDLALYAKRRHSLTPISPSEPVPEQREAHGTPLSHFNIRKVIAGGAGCREREYGSVNAHLNRSMVTITLSA